MFIRLFLDDDLLLRLLNSFCHILCQWLLLFDNQNLLLWFLHCFYLFFDLIFFIFLLTIKDFSFFLLLVLYFRLDGVLSLFWSTNFINCLIQIIKHTLILHQLYLQVMVGLIMIGNEIVDGFDEGAESFAVIFFLQKELLLSENVKEVHETLTSFLAQTLGVGCYV